MLGDLSREADEALPGIRIVFGLTQQIRRQNMRIGGFIGDDQYLGRSGQQIDADIAENLPFGFGHILVPGPDHDIHGFKALHAVGQGSQGLHAAHAKNLVRAAGHH